MLSAAECAIFERTVGARGGSGRTDNIGGVEKVTLEFLRAFNRARRAWSCVDGALLKVMASYPRLQEAPGAAIKKKNLAEKKIRTS